MPAAIPINIVERLADEALSELTLSKSIPHPGEHGRAREEIIRRFLRRLVPATFGIDTGFVIDANGNISRQIDIVIYRMDYHPVFEIGAVKHFLIESVVAVLENKASLTTKRAITEALENISSVKGLDRTGAGKNYKVVGTQRGEPINPDAFNDQVWGALVADRTVSPAKAVEAMRDYSVANPSRRLWPNMVVAVRRFVVQYEGFGEPSNLVTRPQEAVGIACSNPKTTGVRPLVDLAREVVNVLRIAPLIDFRPDNYFPESKPEGPRAPLPMGPPPA